MVCRLMMMTILNADGLSCNDLKWQFESLKSSLRALLGFGQSSAHSSMQISHGEHPLRPHRGAW